MSKNLVIVESPAKAKTIEKFLGKDYHVLSSQGHIRDIEPLGKNSMGIDFAHGYAPNYVVDPKKHHLVETLKAEVKKADTVWLASDEDREGEAIAWHLKEVLGLDKKDTKRIVFHEITKSAIQRAIEQPRDIDYNLVNAQQARRVLDRIVGFELSPVLWKKVTAGLSAGRVQSVAVRLIVEREREIAQFKSTAQYRVTAEFVLEQGAKSKEQGRVRTDSEQAGTHSVLRAELNHRFGTLEEARAFLETCAQAEYRVRDVQKKQGKRSPAPPFTTSTLQQEAARKLKFPVSKTMRLAQSLYEAGHITYMRTDSVNLSSLALATSKQEVLAEYGEAYQKTRQYHTSSKGAQEAHEAIRPSYMDKRKAGETADEQRLYELIWKRTIASQMADAEVETTRVEVAILSPAKGEQERIFVATGEVITFDGFMRAYIQGNDEQEETTQTLPRVAVGEFMSSQEMTAQQTFTKPPYRYTEATLVKKMEELGIGRPSTYATIIETIQSRKYVEKGNVTGHKRDLKILTLHGATISETTKQEMAGADNQKLLPTDLGCITNDFLVAQFPEILSYDFTANEEANFDKIAEGEADWVKTVDTFYKAFHPMLSSVPAGKIAGRELGTDPETGEPVVAKISKMGPCIQIGGADSEKVRFASLKKGQSIFTITLDEALDLFHNALPYTLGELDGEEVVVGEGKFGPYIRHKGAFVSIPKGTDPLTITLDEAQALIEKKAQAQEPIHVYGEIEVLNGRFGPYIKANGNNYKIPKGQDAQALTEEDCREIIASSAPTSGGKRAFSRKKAK
ncbi:MAG: type I DNA topoisomerase [Paludibacteraceae bacterium]|nr:type I DNA topoisomerase [Paludibacteraceae bacterium]